MDRRKMNRITGGMLLFGIGAALIIYLTAAPTVVDPLLGNPMDSKTYVRQIKVIGGAGHAGAGGDEDWFAGLWHGRELAGTVTVLTVAAVFGFRFVATHPDGAGGSKGDDKEPSPGGEREGGGSG